MSAERVEGPGESSLFSLVDELTRRFKSTFASLGGRAGQALLAKPGRQEEAGLDRGVKDITSSSIQAYRYYAEGIAFHERGLSDQAAPLLEKAVEVDPNFAMAHAKLAVVYNNLGLFDKRDEYAKQALARIDRPHDARAVLHRRFLLRTPTRDTSESDRRLQAGPGASSRAPCLAPQSRAAVHVSGAAARKHRAERGAETARHV